MLHFYRSLIIILVTSVILSAQVPETISYQGVLTNAEGIAVTDGEYNMSFILYSQVEGGEELWHETKTVLVADGIFNVILGSYTPLSLPFNASYWLGIVVEEGEELSPRIQLTSSAYSLNAKSVEDSSITSAKIAAGTVIKSINGITDSVNFVEGSNITIDEAGNTLTISSTGGGFSLPYLGFTSTINNGFAVLNTGTGNGVYGGNAGSGNYGYLGSQLYGVYGIHSGTGNFGILGLQTYGIYGYTDNTDASYRYGVYGYATGDGEHRFGVYGRAIGYDDFPKYGVYGYAFGNGGERYGLYGLSHTTDNNYTTYGVYGEATGGGSGARYGLCGKSSGDDYSYKYGVYGEAMGASGRTYAIYGITEGDNGERTGVFGSSSGGNATHYGVRGLVSGTGSTAIYGVHGYASGNGGERYGVYARASGADIYDIFGVKGYAEGGNDCYGVYGHAQDGDYNYAVYASGDIAYTGDISDVSDEKFKENIQPAGLALSKILQLKVKTYQFKSDPQFKHMNLSSGKQYGFIAQELQEVFPELVSEMAHPAPDYKHEDGPGSPKQGESIHYLGIKSTKLIPILVKAIQEQQSQIESLRQQIEELKER
ncbi:MAG: tail fiber domain-containing protein [Calditrichia bacterium]|nr:tail fiber domain-containing protein [Calditrichia bacterium]